MVDKLVLENDSFVIYGNFRGIDGEELFRCSKDDKEMLEHFINKERKCVLLKEDNTTDDLSEIKGLCYVGYFRMYFRNGWEGKWLKFEESDKESDALITAGVRNIVDYIRDMFPYGCDRHMINHLKEHYEPCFGENRYLLVPNNYYRILIDTTYGNDDYPVRIYAYRE